MSALDSQVERGDAAVPNVPVPRDRNVALDFTKGVLVLLMILYHWINYFVSLDGGFYKYIRFITPSFIFITGFLIANVYLTRYRIGDPRLHYRLAERGVKLLALFTILNVVVGALLDRGAGNGMAGVTAFFQNAESVFLTGNGKAAAFSILVPISYVLVCSSFLLVPCRWFKPFLTVFCVLLFAVIFILDRYQYGFGHLELFAVGMLGMVLGGHPVERIDQVAGRLPWLLAAYGAYLAMLVVWNEILPIQIVGVCVNLLLFYAVGLRLSGRGWAARGVILLGKYTLLSYIVQIAVLVILSKLLRRLPLVEVGRWTVSCVGAFGLTFLIIQATDLGRRRWPWADRVYRMVFA